jgi:hypothetical protein
MGVRVHACGIHMCVRVCVTCVLVVREVCMCSMCSMMRDLCNTHAFVVCKM